MKLSEVKIALKDLEKIGFKLPNGKMVDAHFHVTEVGQIAKKFIDCGGTLREEKVINFQLWQSDDYDHRIHPEKLIHIINISESKLGLEDHNVEVEYQGETIGKYQLGFDGKDFLLLTKQTDCLAKDHCDTNLVNKVAEPGSNCCSPGGGCC